MPAEASPYDLGQAYLELHHRLRRKVDEAMSAAGVSMSRAKVLHELAERGPMNQAALAGRLGFAARSVAETVDALERDGLAARAEDPADRRARILTITAAGSMALAGALAIKNKMFDQIFGALDAPERAELIALLKSIDQALTSSGDCLVEQRR